MGLAAPPTQQPFHIWDNNKLFQIRRSVTSMKWDLWGSFFQFLLSQKKQMIQAHGLKDFSWIVDHSNWQFCFIERRNVKFWYGWSDFIHCLVTIFICFSSKKMLHNWLKTWEHPLFQLVIYIQIVLYKYVFHVQVTIRLLRWYLLVELIRLR